MKNSLKMLFLIAICLSWLGFIGAGMSALTLYKNTPGADLAAPGIWPDDSHIARSVEHPTLLLFLHPRCACSRASVEELSRLMADVMGRVSVQIFFFIPQNAKPDWAHGALWQSVEAIPGVQVHVDEGGRLAQRFHGTTSGHAVLYAENGRLLFDGGITVSRGHAGDNAGRDAITALLYGRSASRVWTPVFGCAIQKQALPAKCGGVSCNR